jgi:hypothetical protein
MKRSEIFWTVLGILIQVCVGFIDLGCLFVIQVFLSGICLGFLFDGDKPPFIAWLTPIGVFVLLIGGILVLTMLFCMFVWKKGIDPFNEWINKT